MEKEINTKKQINTKEHRAYIEHQKIKTSDPDKIIKWLGEEWDIKLQGFKYIFNQYDSLFDKSGICIGLGSRTGQEIAALTDCGYSNSVGIDLIAFEPYTIKGDFHNLPFSNKTVSLVYTNAVDHVKKPEIWSREIDRVLVDGGYLLMNCQIGMTQDEFTVFKINNTYQELIKPYFSDYIIIKNEQIPQNVHAMNWETLLQKKMHD